jgi:hypothetical protein
MSLRFHGNNEGLRLSSSDIGKTSDSPSFPCSTNILDLAIQMENFRKPNFELVADILYWMVKL